jgi:predicted transcriptional regulator
MVREDHIYEEILILLPEVGVHLDVAKVIVSLLQHPAASVKSLAKSTELSDSRVREILADFQGLSWVSVTQEDGKKGGPAINIYTLIVPFNTIVSSIEKEVLRQQAEYDAAIEYLRTHS